MLLYNMAATACLLCSTRTASVTTTLAFQVSPNGSAYHPRFTPGSGGDFLEEVVLQAGVKTCASQTFQSTAATVPSAEDFEKGLDDLFQNWSPPTEAAIGCLFVSPTFSSNLDQVVQRAQERLGDNTQLLTVVGGGVVGDGNELEGVCGLSFLGGVLPKGSSVELFHQTDGQSRRIERSQPTMKGHANYDVSGKEESRDPSHLIFADPHCREIRKLLGDIDGIVAGGISVAEPNQPSLAIGKKVLPPGSLIGATFAGKVGLEVVVTQGCRPVGETFRVTSVDGPCIHELDSERAIDKLQEAMSQSLQHTKMMNVPNFKSDDFLGGIHKQDDVDDDQMVGRTNKNEIAYRPHGFALRQMTGFRPRSGSILVCGPQIEEGDFFRFHVQSKEIALEDWRATLKQTGTERLFLGEQAGRALGALQISCMGRGENLFGVPNVDIRYIEQLLPPNTPVSGLMANAEIGPVGIRLGTSEVSKSVLHGFASVVAMLCDYSESSIGAEEANITSCLGNSTEAGAWE